jgi:general nucleoside transport system permease protein
VTSRFLTRRTLAWAGVVVGVCAALVALPPVQARSPVWPVVIGLVALTIGIGSFIRGERRIGGYAIAAGVLGFVIGYLATRSSVGHLEAAVVWSSLFAATLRYATPLMFASIGGLFCERSGVVNIGLEGMMLMGAFFAIWGADVTGTWELGLLIGMLSGGAMALVYAFFAITLRADQIVGGTAVNLLALGLTGYLLIDIYVTGTPIDVPVAPTIDTGRLDGIPLVGNFLFDPQSGVLGNASVMIWSAIVLIPVTYVVVFRTPLGLRLRAVGEQPRAADTVGINVYLTRYAAVTLSGMLAAAGGAYLSFSVASFTPNLTAGRGFIALAALIFGNWRPFGAAAACLLFGFSSALASSMQEYSTSLSTLFEALPYVLTLIAVAGVIGRSIPPASVGRPYKKQ